VVWLPIPARVSGGFGTRRALSFRAIRAVVIAVDMSAFSEFPRPGTRRPVSRGIPPAESTACLMRGSCYHPKL
jgi:hypothetical protein